MQKEMMFKEKTFIIVDIYCYDSFSTTGGAITQVILRFRRVSQFSHETIRLKNINHDTPTVRNPTSRAWFISSAFRQQNYLNKVIVDHNHMVCSYK